MWLGGEKPLKDVFTSTPFELQLRAFNLAAAAAAQNNTLQLLKRPPTLNKPLLLFCCRAHLIVACPFDFFAWLSKIRRGAQTH